MRAKREKALFVHGEIDIEPRLSNESKVVNLRTILLVFRELVWLLRRRTEAPQEGRHENSP